MRSKPLACLLLLLLMWGWVDDLLASTANADPSDDAATSDNDEYLRPAPPGGHTGSEGRPTAVPVPPSPRTSWVCPAVPPLSRGPAPGRLPLGSTDPLYALMSLQR